MSREQGERGRSAASIPVATEGLECDKVQNETEHELKYLVLNERSNKRPIDDVDEYYGEIYDCCSRNSGVNTKTKKIYFQDFQFVYPKLVDIYEEERGLREKEEEANRTLEELKLDGKEEEYEHLKNQLSKGDYKLSDDLQREKSELELQSFLNWTEGDFKAFLGALRRNGRSDATSTVREVSIECGKDPSDVKRYFDTFWQRFKEIEGGEKIIESINGVEELLLKKKDLTKKIVDRFDLSPNNLHNLFLRYGSMKGRVYSDEEDAFLILMLQKHGYGEWKKIVFEIKNSWLFRFDSFFKSRITSDIKKRCDTLIKLIEIDDSER